MRKILILLLLGAAVVLAADEVRISGRILDAATGQPLPGANIQIAGSVLGAVSTRPEMLIAARAALGITGATIMPATAATAAPTSSGCP